MLQRAQETLKKMRQANPGARQLFDEWGVLLKRSIPELIPVLTDAGARARELRQVTPFAGVLSAHGVCEGVPSLRPGGAEEGAP